jgi:creatinine amidohydrolase
VKPPPDPLGHELLAARVQLLPALLRELSRQPPPTAWVTGRVVATGIGSSEAHARYLVWLLNQFTDLPAEFVPLAGFTQPQRGEGRTLVIFSQGLSSNARFALDQAKRFAQTVVFTSATEAGQRAAGRPERAELLAKLRGGGADIVSFPVEDEYTILIRVLGPACGFVAARQWVAQLPTARVPAFAERWPSLENCLDVSLGEVAHAMKQRTADWAAGFTMMLPAPLAEFSQNVGCKFVEGLFWTAPTLVEFLQLAHGPFQQLAARPRPVWLLGLSCDPAGAALADRAVTMLKSIGIEPVVTTFEVAPDVAPLALELLLNPLVVDLARHLGVNQLDWPGKGLDGPIYHLDTPPT